MPRYSLQLIPRYDPNEPTGIDLIGRGIGGYGRVVGDHMRQSRMERAKPLCKVLSEPRSSVVRGAWLAMS